MDSSAHLIVEVLGVDGHTYVRVVVAMAGFVVNVVALHGTGTDSVCDDCVYSSAFFHVLVHATSSIRVRRAVWVLRPVGTQIVYELVDASIVKGCANRRINVKVGEKVIWYVRELCSTDERAGD